MKPISTALLVVVEKALIAAGLGRFSVLPPVHAGRFLVKPFFETDPVIRKRPITPTVVAAPKKRQPGKRRRKS